MPQPPAHRHRAPRRVAALAVAVAIAVTAGLASAQPSLVGEVGIRSGVSATLVGSTLTPSVPLQLFAHLDAEWSLDPVTLRVVLDPSVALPGPAPTEPRAELGLTEAYALYRGADIDLSVGVERLALSGSRLSEPLSLEPRRDPGQPQGLLGARAALYLDGVRIRPAALYHDGGFGGALRVRLDLSGAEFEAHALYLDGAALGLTGSGLVGDLVLYGEAWLLADADLDLATLRGRGALGLSGFWGDALWTVEGAFAPPPFGNASLHAPAFPQFGGQISLPVGDAGALDAVVGVGLPGSLLTPGQTAVAGTASLSYSFSDSDYRFSVGPSAAITELGSTFGLTVTVVGFF
jgi:hypothetical protein